MKKSTPVCKVGFYQINKITNGLNESYEADSGKLIFVARYKKYMVNPNRDRKEFKTLEKAKDYAAIKLSKYGKKKEAKLKTIPKSLYLILIKEQSTGVTFVKVGITAKKFIMRRFSKAYGYEGYVVESILRRIESPISEKLESEIKDKLNKKGSVKKYRPVLKSFSGYSECFDYSGYDDIIKIFDLVANKS
jgi:hypothetical protein